MNLYDLLSRVTFDDLVPTLNTLIIKENQLPYFKMAFDELRMMAPIVSDDIIDVQLDESYIYVDGCQDRWSNVLGKNITLDDEVKLADQVLTAHILWEITFFGFSEEEMKANIGRDYGDDLRSRQGCAGHSQRRHSALRRRSKVLQHGGNSKQRPRMLPQGPLYHR